MRARGNRNDRRISALRAVLFGIVWAIGTIALNLLLTDNRVWVVILVWSVMAVPAAVLWWWLMNGPFAADRWMSRRP